MTEYERITGTIKTALKTRGIRYSELARKLGMSESGVKKILNGKDASFDRVSSMARVLGLELSVLLESAAKPAIREVSLTSRQESFLFRERECFRLYWKLSVERMTAKEFQVKYKISDRVLRQQLTLLDRENLIRLMPGDRIEVPVTGLVRWVSRGPLLEWILKDWSLELTERCVQNAEKKGYLHRLNFFRLKLETKELIQELERLIDEFSRRAE